MRRFHREVQSYRDNNERIMKAQEKILRRMNICIIKLTNTLAPSKKLVLYR
jgi:hypothetical protein